MKKLVIPVLIFIALASSAALASNSVKNTFLAAYPSAAGTRLVTINGVNHCGLCHWDFRGNNSSLNPYGTAIFNSNGSAAAILALGSQDSDGDGFTNDQEIRGTGFSNVPTFAGYKSSNVNSVTNLPSGFTIANLTGFVTPVASGPSGSLQVTLGPAGAITAGAQWNVDGGAWQSSGATVTGLSVASHTVNYRSITGWTAPAGESASITNGVTTTITRDYTQQTGSLQVTLGPAEAVTAGAQWNVDGGAWQNSTAAVTGLSVGSHTVNCKSVTGWIAPVSMSASITNNATTALTRNYTLQAGNIQVTLGPAGAVTAGAQWNVDGGPWQNSAAAVSGLSVASHTVNYKAVAGWNAPASESVSVTALTTKAISRSYTQQAGGLQVILGPAGSVTASAKWNVDGGAWQNSAAAVSALSVGSHTVNYKAVTGWTAPAGESVAITNGVTTVVNRNYIPQAQGGSLGDTAVLVYNISHLAKPLLLDVNENSGMANTYLAGGVKSSHTLQGWLIFAVDVDSSNPSASTLAVVNDSNNVPDANLTPQLLLWGKDALTGLPVKYRIYLNLQDANEGTSILKIQATNGTKSASFAKLTWEFFDPSQNGIEASGNTFGTLAPVILAQGSTIKIPVPTSLQGRSSIKLNGSKAGLNIEGYNGSAKATLNVKETQAANAAAGRSVEAVASALWQKIK